MVTKSYRAAYERSLEHPAEFWLEAARGISWQTPPRQALDAGRAPLYDWFPDGVLNTSYNALDRHVAEGRGAQDALVYDSAMVGTRQSYTYAELTADPDALREIIEKLRPYHAADQIEVWQTLATAGDFHKLCGDLMRVHYDPRYAKSATRKAPAKDQLPLPDLSEATLRDTADRIIGTHGA